MNIIHNQGLVTCMSHVEEFVTRIKIGSSDQAHILLIQKKIDIVVANAFTGDISG